MTPWQWQDKLNYELMLINSAIVRIEYLDETAQKDHKSFMGYLHLAHSHARAFKRDLAVSAKMAEEEMASQDKIP